MTAPTLHEALGPPPFRFVPSPGVLVSPAFSWPFRLLATALAGGAALWLVLLYSGALAGANHRSTAMAWFAAAVLLMLVTWWHIVAGKTTLSPQALHQSWVWDKHMDLRELAYAKLIRVRGLDWLIAPRLYVRTLMGKFAVFYAADPAMLSNFERLVKELHAFRHAR